VSVYPTTRTASGSVGFQRQYVSDHARYELSGCLIVQGTEGIAGVTDPIIEDPIDFEAELANRRHNRVAINESVDSDTANDVFGI
jgi:hypothetical protein